VHRGGELPVLWSTPGRVLEFFDLLLAGAGVVCTPGAGFGKCGEGYVRISAFNDLKNVSEAMERIGGVI
jgi:LL-diaminopimelate aminotransferase